MLGVQVILTQGRGCKRFTSSVLASERRYTVASFRGAFDTILYGIKDKTELVDDIQLVWEKRSWDPEVPECVRAADSSAAASGANPAPERSRRRRRR